MGGERSTEKRRSIGADAAVGRNSERDGEFSTRIISRDAARDVIRANGVGDAAAAWIARHQLNLITTGQLLLAGIGHGAIETRCRRCTLTRIFHGVYLWGQPPMLPAARELAGVLACGEGAFISHRTGAAMWGLAAPQADELHITVAGGCRRRRDGLTVHRTRGLHSSERRLLHGIPVTSPARTLLDFATQAQPDELERAVAEAYVQRLATERDLLTALELNRGRAGAAALRTQLDRDRGSALTRSEAERLMMQLLRQARLPPPRTNLRINGFEADLVWPEHKLIVEVDGYQFHGHRRAFERDRRRDAAHALAGYTVIRITWRQLTQEPMAVAATIAGALAMARARAVRS